MTFKKKAIISACTLALVVVISIFSVVAVLAASQISVTTQVRVTYSSSIVAGKMKTSYKLGTDAWITDIESTLDSTSGDDGSDPAPVNVDGLNNIVLTEAKPYVYFRFVIENTSDTNNFQMQLTYANDTDKDENVTLHYYVGTAVVADENLDATLTKTVELPDASGSVVILNPASATDAPPVVYGTQSTEVQASTGTATVYVYAKVAITELKKDATFTGSFNWVFQTVA